MTSALQDSKRLTTLQARFALRGLELIELGAGGYLITNATGRTRRIANLDAAEAYVSAIETPPEPRHRTAGALP